MPIAKSFLFTQRQRAAFARLFRVARAECGLSQLAVAQQAFDYKRSHCKVSRVERGVMKHVDAFAIDQIARVLGVPRLALEAVDPQFSNRVEVARVASAKGFWTHAVAA